MTRRGLPNVAHGFSPHRFFMSLAIPIIGFLAVPGCGGSVGVKEIASFTAAVNSASVSFSAISSDFANTCLQLREYELTSPADLRLLPVVNPTPDPASTTRPLEVTDAYPNCGAAESVSQQWQSRNAIIVGYVRALGAIAGVDVKPSGLDALAGKLSDVGAMKDSQIKPFSDLASSISNLLLRGKQGALLKMYSHRAAVPLTTAVQSLRTFVSNDYIPLLSAEQVILDRRYRDSLRRQLRGHYDFLDIHRERVECVANRGNIAARIGAANAYSNAIQSISDTNADIVRKSDTRRSAGQIFAETRIYIVPLLQDVAVLNKTFH